MTPTRSKSKDPEPPSPATNHALHEAKRFYTALGWPVGVDAHNHRVVLRTGEVLDALIMPYWLGALVSATLCTHMLYSPVCTDDDGRWWTFLTEKCPHSKTVVAPDLRHAKVHVVPHGAEVVLPHPHDESRWMKAAQPVHALPPWNSVVAVTRRILQQHR
jgi:hypothetical protein